MFAPLFIVIQIAPLFYSSLTILQLANPRPFSNILAWCSAFTGTEKRAFSAFLGTHKPQDLELVEYEDFSKQYPRHSADEWRHYGMNLARSPSRKTRSTSEIDDEQVASDSSSPMPSPARKAKKRVVSPRAIRSRNLETTGMKRNTRSNRKIEEEEDASDSLSPMPSSTKKNAKRRGLSPHIIAAPKVAITYGSKGKKRQATIIAPPVASPKLAPKKSKKGKEVIIVEKEDSEEEDVEEDDEETEKATSSRKSPKKGRTTPTAIDEEEDNDEEEPQEEDDPAATLALKRKKRRLEVETTPEPIIPAVLLPPPAYAVRLGLTIKLPDLHDYVEEEEVKEPSEREKWLDSLVRQAKPVPIKIIFPDYTLEECPLVDPDWKRKYEEK